MNAIIILQQKSVDYVVNQGNIQGNVCKNLPTVCIQGHRAFFQNPGAPHTSPVLPGEDSKGAEAPLLGMEDHRSPQNTEWAHPTEADEEKQRWEDLLQLEKASQDVNPS